MKVAIVVACIAVIATVVSAGGYDDSSASYDHDEYRGWGGYPGFQRVPNGIAAAYSNEDRQLAVNHVADHVGSGLGTGRFYGVPGTGGHYDNYGYYGAYPAYGHGHGHGYGYGHGYEYGHH